MGYCNDFHVIVKPKEEYRDKWEAGGKTIHEDLGWLVDKKYKGVWGMFELDATPYLNTVGYLEFRGNNKYADIYTLLDVLDELEEYIFLIHYDNNEYIEVIASEALNIPFENGVFKLIDNSVTVVNPVYSVDSNDGDTSTADTEARDVTLKRFELGGVTFRTNITIFDIRWHALSSKHFDEIMEKYRASKGI